MNRRENMLAIMNHESHDHVGNYMTDIYSVGGDKELFENGPVNGGLDGFGCKWEKTASALGAGLPAPGYTVLEDVTAWEDIVKFPDLDAYDWETAAAIQTVNFNEYNQVMEYGMWNGQFLRFTHLLGFENGLCALYEEPEASFALLEAITDYKIRLAERVVHYFHPDSICTFDDVATERGPFMSPDIYRDLIKPGHTRFNKAVKDMGVIPNLHVCGKPEILVGDFVDEGAYCWEVCQPENDLVTLAKKYGHRLAFLGGFDMKGKLSYSNPTELELRLEARKCIDAYAPAGNFAFMGMIMYSDPKMMIDTMEVLSDEGLRYGTNYYRRNPN